MSSRRGSSQSIALGGLLGQIWSCWINQIELLMAHQVGIGVSGRWFGWSFQRYRQNPAVQFHFISL